MKSVLKNILFNPQWNYTRSGWRMLMFLFVFSVSSVLVGYALQGLAAIGVNVKFVLINQSLGYGVLLLVTVGWVRLYEKRPVNSVGLALNDTFGKDLALGCLIGGGMMTAIFAAEWSLGFVQLTWKGLPLNEIYSMTSISMLIFVVGAFGEELLFRGYLFQTLTEGTNKITAVAVFALFFASAHLGNPNVTVFSVVNIALAGVWLSVAYYKTRTLWFPIGLHFSWNFLQNHLFSFPVSGMDFKDYQLGILIQRGPEWLTGGAFGPEGGALTTITLFISTALIYYSPWIGSSDSAWRYEQWILDRKATAASVPTEQPPLGPQS